ncbi:hypothetical protein KEH51_14640 [[Brevibacterium] frigoritolerans]|uniref:Uncharacterized protein n=1 Tax=Peribacillus frigoritolerans TaxID=450367 RepID=A0A941FHX5_9BACI|nr:hypothetical protein [Peribacillus frigoritolerans]
MAAPYLFFIKTTIPLSIRSDLLNFCEAGTAPSLHSFSSTAYLVLAIAYFLPKTVSFPLQLIQERPQLDYWGLFLLFYHFLTVTFLDSLTFFALSLA